MKKHIKEIGKHSIVYTISTFLTKATGLLLIPIYTRYLSTSDFGIIANVTAIVSFFSIFYMLGMEAAWSRFFFDQKDKSDEQKVLLGNIFLFIFFIGLISSIFLTFFSEPLFYSILPDLEFYPYVVLGIWTAFFGLFFNLKNSLFRVRQQSFQFGVLSLSRFVITSLVIIIVVAGLKYGALGKVAAQFTVWGVFFLFIFFLLWKDIKIQFQWKKLKQAVQYGLSVFPHSISNMFITVFDRIFLTNIRGLEATGIYTVGFQFGSVMQLITYSINLSWSPFFMKTAKEQGDEAKVIFSRLTTYYVMLVYFIGLVITFYSKEMVHLFTTKDYYEAAYIIPIYVFNYVLNGLYFMASAKIFYVKKAVKYLSFLSITTLSVNIIFNFFLIPLFGISGAAWARFISTLCLLVLAHGLSQKFYYIKYEYVRIVKLTVLTMLFIALYYIINATMQVPIMVMISIKLIFLAIYLLLLVGIKLMNINELKSFVLIFKKN